MKISISGIEEVSKELALRPKQMERASRLTVNQVVKELHKDLGHQIPNTAALSVVGFRRHRIKKRLAKAKDKIIMASVWVGTKSVAATYAKGKFRQVKGVGVAVGRYLFKDSFWRTMKNGRRIILHRTKRTKSGVEEVRISLPSSHEEIKKAVRGKSRRIENILEYQLEKQFKKSEK